MASISDKFYRNVRLTLTRNPAERMPVAHHLKAVKEEFDRMMELSPPISMRVVTEFQETFKDQPAYTQIIKPDICGDLRATQDFVYTPTTPPPTADDTENPEQAFRREFEGLHGRVPLEAELAEFRRNANQSS